MDLEFVQFHPTGLRNGVLVTEGCRGEGAILVNARRRALHGPLRAQQDGAGQPRRRVARRGRGARRGARRRRLHPARPAAHRRREDPHAPAAGARALDGHRRGRPLRRAHPRQAHAALLHGRHQGRRRRPLAAASRTSSPPASAAASRCTAPTGWAATRCSTALLFGRRAGEAAAAWAAAHAAAAFPPAALRDVQGEIASLLERTGGERHATLRRELQQLMLRDVGIYRERAALQAAVAEIARPQGALRARRRLTTRAASSTPTCCRPSRPATCSTSPSASPWARSTARRAAAATRGATTRSATTSTGCDTASSRHSGDGPVCEYAPVTITRFQPEARSY